MTDVIYREESFLITGKCLEVYNTLGRGFLESVYKEALEYEFIKANIPYKREQQYLIPYKNIVLNHKFYADFVVYDKIILEIKAANSIINEHIKQTLNYLAITNFKLGIIYNFSESSLKYHRVVL